MNLFDRKQSGYTLLFATLTASLVLGVVVFIVGVTRKQYILSSTARDSIYSFYAANSALECVAKTGKNGGLLVNVDDYAGDGIQVAYSIACGNNQMSTTADGNKVSNISVMYDGGTDSGIYKIFSLNFTVGFADPGPNGIPDSNVTNTKKLWGCADVTIDLYNDVNDPSIHKKTVVTARGYNLCKYDSSPSTLDNKRYTADTSSLRTVERTIQWTME